MTDPDRDVRVDVRLKRALEVGTLPRELLVCGPAGTGKTFGILCWIHLLAADYPNLRILFCRQTRASLTESVCVTYEQEILPLDGAESIAAGALRRNRSSYRYPSGSEIVLGGMDNPTRIASTAWDLAFINESIELQEEGYETVGSRLNRPGRDPRFGFLIADTNPGDPAHWLRKRIDAGETPLWDTGHRANPALFDGAAWTEAGELYMERLGRLKGTRRKRYLEGLWAAGEGQWYETFGEGHISERAAYHPAYPVHLAIDCGVHTGAVLFQVRPPIDAPLVTVFGDFYAFNLPAFDAAKAILALMWQLGLGGRADRIVADSAGKDSTAIGPTVWAEYARAGLKRLEPWPKYPGSVADGLNLLESFIATDPPGLLVHPRCSHLIGAFGGYMRDKRGGQWIDRPKDPQHPYEELMDAIRGGLQDKFPSGRRPAPTLVNRRVTSVMY